ncbi:MAG TPA: 8-amino-7-oxononanoate synthase [Steroidobacteraceae bacterium]
MRTDAQRLARELSRLEAQHSRRQRRIVEAFPEAGDPTAVRIGDRRLRNFCSNDYLGLSQHPAVVRAAADCMTQFGFGAGAAHLVSGHTREHHALEEELAAFTGRQRALLFSTGYMANLGVISALVDRQQLVLADRLNHASLLDAARLCGARLRRYAHADAASAAQMLEDSAAAHLIVTDGVFSMDGDLAPVAQLTQLAAARDCDLMVDDAHGLGVIGATGRGTLQVTDTMRAVPILVGTLGKAFGTFGAFVAGDSALIEYLIQRARTYIYSTALPAAVAAASRAALRLAQSESWRRQRLQELVQRFRTAAGALGLPLTSSTTPIQPLIVGDSAHALALSEGLMSAGFWVAAIRPPTVPRGAARLRITFSAAHHESDVDALADTLGRLWRERSAA